jgi:hypothetical protein
MLAGVLLLLLLLLLVPHNLPHHQHPLLLS